MNVFLWCLRKYIFMYDPHCCRSCLPHVFAIMGEAGFALNNWEPGSCIRMACSPQCCPCSTIQHQQCLHNPLAVKECDGKVTPSFCFVGKQAQDLGIAAFVRVSSLIRKGKGLSLYLTHICLSGPSHTALN